MQPKFENFQANTDDDRVFVPRRKYWSDFSGTVMFGLLAMTGCGLMAFGQRLPRSHLNRSAQRILRQYSGRKVLDLEPKLGDEFQNMLYETSKAERVEFLVKKKFSSTGKIDKYEELSPEDAENRGKAMMLDNLVNYDPMWLSSSVTYGIVDEAETRDPAFVKYDSVVLINLLSQLTEKSASRMLDEALRLCQPEGNILIVDFGASSNDRLQKILKHFTDGNEDEEFQSHHFHKWFCDDSRFEVIELSRTLFGTVYGICLKPRKKSSA